MTDYIVLQKDKAGETWGQVGKDRVTAVSAKAAISETLKTRTEKAGTFVAVPARSWRPVKVQVETALKFS